MSDFKAKMHQNPISAGAPSRTPLVGELTALPQTPCLDLRGLILRGEEGKKVLWVQTILKIDPEVSVAAAVVMACSFGYILLSGSGMCTDRPRTCDLCISRPHVLKAHFQPETL